MIEPLHLILVSETDVSDGQALVSDHLGRVGYDARLRQVASSRALAAALAERAWDAVLVEDIPALPAIEVLAWLQRKQPGMPAILLFAPGREAGPLFASGAVDAVPRDDWNRLGAVLAKHRRQPGEGHSSEAFLGLASQIPAGVFRTTPDGRFLHANQAMAHIVGAASVEELLDMDIRSSFSYPRELFLKQLEAAGEVRDLEISWTRPDGSPVVTVENARAVRDASGAILYFEGALQDVSDQRNARAAEARLVAQFEALAHFSSVVGEAQSIEAVQTAIIDASRAALDAEGVLLILRRDDGSLVTAAREGVPEPDRAVAEAIWGALGDDIWFSSGSDSKSFAARLAPGMEAVIALPLLRQGQRRGMLLTVHRSSIALSSVEAVAKTMGGLVSSALAQWDAEATARDSEATLGAISRATDQILYRRRFGSATYDFISASISRLTGPQAEGSEGRSSLSDFIIETTVKAGAGLPEGKAETDTEAYDAQHLLRTQRGDLRWVEDRAHLWIAEDGQAIGIAGVLTDVTVAHTRLAHERRQAARLVERQRVLFELSVADGLPSEVWPKMTEETAKLCEVDRVSIWLTDRSSTHLHCHDLYTLPAGEHGTAPSLQLRHLEHVEDLGQQRTIAIADVVVPGDHSALVIEHFLRCDVGAVVAAPILREGELGGFVLLEHCGTPREWTAGEKDFAAALADVAALVLERASRARAEGALRASEQRYRAISELASDYACGIRISDDGAGIVDWATEAFKRITGFDVADFPDALVMLRALVPPADWRQALRQIAHLKAGRPVDLQSRIVSSSGDLRWVRHRAQPVPAENGDIRYVYVTGRDISERIDFEMQLQEARERAEEARAEAEVARAGAEDLMIRRSAFVANMSHEIRTPLTGIIGFAEVLAEELDDQHGEFAGLLASSGRRLLETLNSVLDLARLENGDVKLEPTEVDPEQLARETIDLLQSRARARNLKVSVECAEDCTMLADRGCLARILTNLTSNAIKFTDQGSITVSIRKVEESVVLSVADTGIGISNEFLPHLYDEFRQQDDVGDGERPGSGLGLTITRRLVQLMNGTISVDTRLGVGTTFTVILPRIAPPPAGRGVTRAGRNAHWESDPANQLPAQTLPQMTLGPPDDRNGRAARALDNLTPPAGSGVPDLSSLFGLQAEDQPQPPLHPDEPGDQASYHVRSVFRDDPAPIENQDVWMKLGWEDQEDSPGATGENRAATLGTSGTDAEQAGHFLSRRKGDEPTDGRLRLLIVEDNEETRQLLIRVLDSHYQVAAVSGARQALEMMARSAFDVLILDIHLGGKQTGSDILRIARALPGYELVTAIALTAYALPGDRERFMQEGFDGYAAKPFSLESLLGVLSDAGAPAGVRQ